MIHRLQALGVYNLRMLGGPERSPLQGAISPTFREPSEQYGPGLLGGLDWALAEIDVFDADRSTQTVIRDWSRAMSGAIRS